MNDKEMKSAAVESYSAFKGKLSLEEKCSAFVPPLIFWRIEGEDPVVISVPELDTRDLKSIMVNLKDRLGEPASIMFMSDAHAKHIAQEDYAAHDETYERGQLAKDFENNKADVGECLIFAFATLDEISAAYLPYHYNTEHDHVVYDSEIDGIEFLPGLDSLVPDALCEVFITV